MTDKNGDLIFDLTPIISAMKRSQQNHVDSLSIAFGPEIHPLVDVIDNLRRIGLPQDIDLPKVVVVGDTDSGKSAVIEELSGIQLPRGTDRASSTDGYVASRCPLELQLRRAVRKPWRATLSYTSRQGLSESVNIDEPNAVEKSIRDAQEKMCYTDQSVNKDLITLRVESPAETAPDLTLIDLPDIVRTDIEAQTDDIAEQIRNIIMDYIENKNTVILCVVSANLDAAENESIKIAKEVDPDGTRTLGVITKPDMVHELKKNEVICLLNNEKIKLVKGFHMVKCRSQKKLNFGMSPEESRPNEKEYFQNDKYYRKVSKSLLGTPNLALRITTELVQIIKDNLPELKEKISFSLHETRGKLSNLPQVVPEGSQEKLIYLIGVISEMNMEIMSSFVTGKSSLKDDNLFYEWRTEFSNFRQKINLIKTDAMTTRFSLDNLRDEMLRKRGKEISGLINFDLFVSLMTDHVMSYKVEAEKTLEEMRKRTDHVLQNIIQLYFGNLSIVASNLKRIAHGQLEIANNKTLERIATIFEEEKLIYTSDDAFEKEMEMMKKEQAARVENVNKNAPTLGIFAPASSPNQIFTVQNQRLPSNPIPDPLKETTDRMLSIIKCYLKIVHSRLGDTIPMAIRQCLHMELCSSLKRKFIGYATSEEIDVKVTETKDLVDRRKHLTDKISRLQQANIEMSSLYNFF